MKKIAIIGTVGLPARYGGFETFAEQLVTRLSKKYEFIVFCSKKHYRTHNDIYKNAHRVFLPFNANGYQSVIYDIYSIIYSLFRADTLLILGVSGCIILPFIKLFRRKIIVSVDGLDTKREKWSSLIKQFLVVSERYAVKHANVVIADNKYIQKYLKEKYNCESKLIEYGSDHSISIKKKPDDIKKYPFINNKYAIAISRIEKENHCEVILEAFSRITEYELVFIGTWNKNKYSRYLYNKHHSNKNITLLDPIYNSSIINLLRSNASMFIHGNGAGGTNPGLLEAMNIGLPILAYDVVFNRNVTKNNALFFTTPKELIKEIKNNIEDRDIAEKNRLAVETIAKKKYRWTDIINKYEQIF